MPELSFHRLPLQDQNLLEKWLVNIRRANINVNSYSRVCSTHQGKNDVPTVFAWTKAVNSRPPLKQRPEPVVSTPRFHSIGITTSIQPDNHVSTCCTMTEEDGNQSTPLRIEQIQDDQKCLHFYTGFLSFQMLMVCFNFLGTAMLWGPPETY